MPTDLDAEPTIEEVRELYDHNQNAWTVERGQAKAFSNLYWGEHGILIPDTANKDRKRKIEPERMETKEAPRVVDLITSFYASPANIGAQWTGAGSREASAVDALEVGINEAIDQLNPPHDAPRARRVFQQVLFGKSAQLGPVYGDAYYWDFPYKTAGESEEDWAKRYEEWRKGGPIPMVYMDLPAEATYPASFGTLNDLVLCEMDMTAWELAEIFSPDEIGNALPTAYNASDPFKVVIMSNRMWLAYAIIGDKNPIPEKVPFVGGKKDAILRTVEHKMGRSAIRIHPGMTRRKEKGRYWLSTLQHVADLIVGADRMLSMAATAQKFDAFPPLKRFTKAGVGEGATANIKTEQEGDIFDFEMDDQGHKLGDIQPLIQPQAGQATQELLAFLLHRIERKSGTIPELEGAFSAETAWATNFAVDVATNMHSPLTQNIIAADMDDAEGIMRAVEVSGEPLFLKRRGEGKSEIKLLPDQMPGWIPALKGEYKLTMTTNRIAAAQTGLAFMERIVATGMPISPEWVMETFMDIEQPWQEWKRSVAWKAIMSDGVQKRLQATFLEEADEMLSEDEAMSVEEFEARFGRLAPEAQQQLQGARQALLGEAQGAGRAGAPFSSQPGGPKPTAPVV